MDNINSEGFVLFNSAFSGFYRKYTLFLTESKIELE